MRARRRARARSCSTPPPPRAAAAGCTSSTSRWRTSRRRAPRGDDADPGVAMRRADAAAHRADLAARWAELLGRALDGGAAGVRLARRARRPPQALLVGSDAPAPDFVGGAELPGRRGPPGRRRGAGARRAGRPGVGLVARSSSCATASPIPAAARSPPRSRRPHPGGRGPRRHAPGPHGHARRAASGPPAPHVARRGPGAPREPGGAGLGRASSASTPTSWCGSTWRRPSGSGGRSALETYDRRHADRARGRRGRPPAARPRSPSPRASPSAAAAPGGRRARPRCGRSTTSASWSGATPRCGCAARASPRCASSRRSTPRSGCPARAPDEAADPVGDGALEGADLVEAVALARAWRRDVPLVRRVRRPTVARGEVEVDVDMESLGEDGAYLWGALLSGADIGLEPGYRGFVTWDPLPTRDEGRSFGEFWTWLTDVRARCAERGLDAARLLLQRAGREPLAARLRRALRRHGRRAAGVGGRGVHRLRRVDRPLPRRQRRRSSARTARASSGSRRRRASPGTTRRPAGRTPCAGTATRSASTGASPTPAQRERLLVYNADDVRATWTLRTWLTSDARARGPVPRGPLSARRSAANEAASAARRRTG